MIADWEPLQPLGHGSMGTVTLVRARASTTLKLGALKRALDSSPRFLREMHILAQLRHPGIVAVLDYDAGVDAYLVMEYVDGARLSVSMLNNHPERAPDVFRALYDALAYLHARGVCHRDLKPDNIVFRNREHSPVIVDFGLAKERLGPTYTEVGMVAGTLAYLPPESNLLTADPQDVGRYPAAGDVYSTAQIWVESIRGKRAVQAMKGEQKALDPGEYVDPQLRELLIHATDPDPRLRWSAARCVAWIDAYAGKTNMTPPAADPRTVSQEITLVRRVVRQHTRLAVGVVASVAVAAVVGTLSVASLGTGMMGVVGLRALITAPPSVASTAILASTWAPTERVKPEGVKPEGVKPEGVKPEGVKPARTPSKVRATTVPPQLTLGAWSGQLGGRSFLLAVYAIEQEAVTASATYKVGAAEVHQVALDGTWDGSTLRLARDGVNLTGTLNGKTLRGSGTITSTAGERFDVVWTAAR